jgi:hypothetical protein
MSASPFPSSNGSNVELPAVAVTWPVVAWFALAAGVEGMLTVLLWRGMLDAWVLFILHLAVCVVAAAVAWGVPALRADRSIALAVVVMTGTGVLGVVGAALSLIVTWLLRHQHHTIEEWYTQLFPKFAPDAHAALWRRVGQRASDRRQPLEVIPFLDLLQHGSIPQKQSVISLISTAFRPAFAPALRAALTDSQNVIRVQAATAIARLENQFLEDTLRLEARLKSDTAGLAAVTALAQHYDDYAFTGLLDAGREADCRDKALALYERARALAPDDGFIATRLGRLLLRLGRYEEAEASLRVATSKADSHEPRLWLMECYFRQRRYGDLRRVAGEVRDGGTNIATWPVEVAPTLRLWMGEPDVLEESA